MKKAINSAIKAALMLVVAVGAARVAYSSTCTVKAVPSTDGGVYVTKDSTGTPSYYAAEDPSSQTGWADAFGWTYYAYYQANEGCEFAYWNNSETGTTSEYDVKTSGGWKYISIGISSGKSKTVYAHFHRHSMAYVADGLKITYYCTNSDGKCQSKPSTTATLTAADTKVYDGKAYTASKDNDAATIKYYSGESEIDAPVNVGSYTVKMTYGEETVSKDFTITPAPIDAISLVANEFYYDGTEKTVTLNPVTANGLTLTEGTDYTVTGNTATGVATGDTEYTVTVKPASGNFSGTQTTTWVIKGHTHTWGFTLSGATLTAKCTTSTSPCPVEGATIACELTVTGGSDGVQPTFEIANKAAFLENVNKNAQIASISDTFTVTRLTDDGASYDKWYVGNYKVECVATVNGEEKTLVKEFSIAKAGEYTTGWAVSGSRDIRYDSWAEALTAASSGDTIYYRNDNISATSLNYSTDKNLTLNFGGATITYQLGEGKGEGSDVTIVNSGSGKLTMANVTLKQPYGYEWAWGYDKVSHNFIMQGNFVFVSSTTLQVDGDDFKTYSTSGLLEVTGGIHHCQYLENGGDIQISGGNYLYTDHCKPSLLKTGYVVVTKTQEGVGSYYTVVPHEHNLYYVTNGNIITLKCQGDGYEGCDWTLNERKLTLTATDAFEGTTYTGAAYTYDSGFQFEGGSDPVIEYYKDNNKVETPSEYGNYEARVTVTVNGNSATAVKAFAIKHVHKFRYDIAPSNILTATCTNEVSTCDIEGRSTAITLTVSVNGDGVQPTYEIANKEAFLGFVNRDATVATIGEITTVRNTSDGAAVSKWYVGNYTASCTVTIDGVGYTLTKDFAIEKPAGGYTSGWEVGSTGIRYLEEDLSIAYATASDGDTIYYRDGNRDFTTHEYSVGEKNLTIDFGGATLKHVSSAGAMTIKNESKGTLTIKNVNIQQPKYAAISYQISIEGNIIFGDGVTATNEASNPDRYLTMTVNSGSLIVSNGCYQCGFAKADDNVGLNLAGGKYWENDQPAIWQYSYADHICREIEGDYKYEIVEHLHVFNYTVEGNVITGDCKGEYAAYCYWHQNLQTATLTANDAEESAEPYAGASVEYTALWVGDKPAITYWQGETQLESAPTRYGDYTAKLTIGGVTAEAAFTLTPVAITITVQNPTNATVEVFENETEIVSETESYSVTHGSKVTAIYTADDGYEPAAVTNVIACAENGDAIAAPSFKKKGPEIIPPVGGDPETDPEIQPVEGTNGVYAVEVKTNTTTVVNIDGLGSDDTVIVPPQINAVIGSENSPIATNQVKIVADATNTTGMVKVDITPAFTIAENGDGVTIELNSEAVVTIKITGKEDEQIAVKPELGTAAGTEVSSTPFVVSEDKVSTGVKTIPGLTYNLLTGDGMTDITNVVKTIVAEDTRIVLEVAKELEKAAKFYKIEVEK